MKNFKEEFSKKIENIENDNKKILEKKKFDEAVIIDNQSDIFNSLEEIDFLINRIKEEQKNKKRKIHFKFLYKATDDGKTS